MTNFVTIITIKYCNYEHNYCLKYADCCTLVLPRNGVGLFEAVTLPTVADVVVVTGEVVVDVVLVVVVVSAAVVVVSAGVVVVSAGVVVVSARVVVGSAVDVSLFAAINHNLKIIADKFQNRVFLLETELVASELNVVAT